MNFVLYFLSAAVLLLNSAGAHENHLHQRHEEEPHAIYEKRANVPAASIIRPPFPPYVYRQCEICCGSIRYNGLFPSTTECCGKLPYDINTAVCCNNTILRINQTENRYQMQCCGSEIFNSTIKTCCGNKIYDKNPLETCCGNTQIKIQSNVCCNNNIQPYPSYNTWACCGTAVFDHTKQFCNNNKLTSFTSGIQPFVCGGKIVDKNKYLCCKGQAVLKKSNFTLCCGSQGYESNVQACCGNTPQTVKGVTSKCCGSRLIDSTKEGCCNGVPQPLPSSFCQSGGYGYFSCCGSKLYDQSDSTKNFFCCNDNLFEKNTTDSYIYDCCGSQLYNKNRQNCCNETVYQGVNSGQCCGSKSYDASVQTCCADKLYPLGQVPNNICCCPDGGCNIIFPIPFPVFK